MRSEKLKINMQWKSKEENGNWTEKMYTLDCYPHGIRSRDMPRTTWTRIIKEEEGKMWNKIKCWLRIESHGSTLWKLYVPPRSNRNERMDDDDEFQPDFLIRNLSMKFPQGKN
jgi:hypothetical protein